MLFRSSTPSKCTGEFAVECNDGSCDVANGVVIPCLSKGGVKGQTLGSMVTLFDSQEKPNLYQEVYNDTSVSSPERDCKFQYISSAKPKDMPDEATEARREADFIKRCLENKQSVGSNNWDLSGIDFDFSSLQKPIR